MGKFEWISLKGNMPPKADGLLKYQTGNCRDEASFVVYLSRSLGIPAAIDFTPHWGNRSNSHSWSVLLKPDGKATPFIWDVCQVIRPSISIRTRSQRYLDACLG